MVILSYIIRKEMPTEKNISPLLALKSRAQSGQYFLTIYTLPATPSRT
jgi:hypothetical protein